MILVGFLMGAALRQLGALPLVVGDLDLSVVGYIIPGLLGIWFARQGIVETLSTAVTAAVIVRLVLLITVGEELGP